MTDEYTNAEEAAVLYKALATSESSPMPEEKFNTHTFLHRVATADDTTKIGFLTSEELGRPLYPVRALKEMAVDADKIMNNQFFKDYFNAQAEVTTATSLSYLGFLVKQATTTTKQVADVTKPKTENKGWFKKKEDNNANQLQT